MPRPHTFQKTISVFFVFFREDDKNDDDKNNNENSHINIATGILCNTRPYEKMKIEMMG